MTRSDHHTLDISLEKSFRRGHGRSSSPLALLRTMEKVIIELDPGRYAHCHGLSTPSPDRVTSRHGCEAACLGMEQKAVK